METRLRQLERAAHAGDIEAANQWFYERLRLLPCTNCQRTTSQGARGLGGHYPTCYDCWRLDE